MDSNDTTISGVDEAVTEKWLILYCSALIF
jgi:hypothetical protein